MAAITFQPMPTTAVGIASTVAYAVASTATYTIGPDFTGTVLEVENHEKNEKVIISIEK